MSALPVSPWTPSDEQMGWYGKLPAAGDFLHRRMPHELQVWWDRWMNNGLIVFRRHPDVMTRLYAVAPVWNFLIPATLGVDELQMGCLAPSCDRVGRYYPICVTLRLPVAAYSSALLDGAAAWYWQCGSSLLRAIRHGTSPDQLDDELRRGARHGFAPPARGGVDDILSVLGAHAVGAPGAAAGDGGPAPQMLNWPELPLCFNPQGNMSYWWTNQSDASPLRMVAHGGGLNVPLFSKLFSQGMVT